MVCGILVTSGGGDCDDRRMGRGCRGWSRPRAACMSRGRAGARSSFE